MQFADWVFHFRWVEWIFGASVLVTAGGVRLRKAGIIAFSQLIKQFIEKNYLVALSAICIAFFVLGAIGKFSQYWSMNLHGQDFWLFVDILEQMKKGGSFLTRFAPHAIGYVQHGAVHPMWTWGALLPLAALIGSVPLSILYNPAMLASAGWVLGYLSKERWGRTFSLLIAISFLVSTQVGKILTYEVHPEAAYPFFGFLWLWAMGCDGSSSVRGKVRGWTGALAILFLMGIKEDSFLVLGPALILTLGPDFFQKRQISRRVLASAILGGCCIALQILMVKKWSTGTWGPTNWEGSPVLYGAGVGSLKGLKWSGWPEILEMVRGLLGEFGGVWGVLKRLGLFLVSRPWLSLVILAPWVLSQPRFWVSILPLACVYSLLDGPSHLWTYYSAPFLIMFWFCAVSPDFKNSVDFTQKTKWAQGLWLLGSCVFLGSGGIQWVGPNADSGRIRAEAKQLLPCLRGKGLVASHLLPWVPLEAVWTERIPKRDEDWDRLSFLLFSPEVGRYEIPLESAKLLYQKMKMDPHWEEFSGPDCSPKAGAGGPSPVVLFLRKLNTA